MSTLDLLPLKEIPKVEPVCPVFGECGGCLYQHIPYKDELVLKEESLRRMIETQLGLSGDICEPMVASPKPYSYRNRLDLSLLKNREGEIFVGFMPERRFRILPVDACPIAEETISNFLPELKKQAQERLPSNYRIASLVVKTGDDGRVFWGGIGRRSLRLKKEDYLWTEVNGRRVYYSLDTFFQANTSILPLLKERLNAWVDWNVKKTLFLDLYAGVGLFGILLADQVQKVIMIEDNKASLELARFNTDYHRCQNIQIIPGRVEEQFPRVLEQHRSSYNSAVAIIDPPRKGLSSEAFRAVCSAKRLSALFYLSCNPESLCRDLANFMKEGWRINRVQPFDFFPKTKHIETLVLLTPPRKAPGAFLERGFRRLFRAPKKC